MPWSSSPGERPHCISLAAIFPIASDPAFPGVSSPDRALSCRTIHAQPRVHCARSRWEVFVRSARARRVLVGVVAIVAAVASAVVVGNVFTSATGTPTDGATRASDSAIVVFAGDPLLTHPKTSGLPAPLNLDAAPVRAVRQELAAQHDRFRDWLDVLPVTVTREYHLVLNAVAVDLDGASIDDLRDAPGVRGVYRTRSYEPLDKADPDLRLINALKAWHTQHVGGAANAGADIDVGIVDSGIDVEHPCFDDADYPIGVQRGDLRFTNNKVVVARAFHGAATLTPEAVGAHGTHVAGTVACNANTPASMRGADVPYQVSGVAPAARLGNYNVFPGDVGAASDEDLLDALEAAYRDGMDVVNLSLGAPVERKPDPIATAVNNLDEAGVVVTAAAGNNGPGEGTVASPGTARRALTSGASTVGHFVGTAVTADGKTFPAASGDFPTVRSDRAAPIGVVRGDVNGLGTACEPLDDDLTGQLAVVSRGECSFSAKVRAVEDAGAVAALVVNDVAGDPTSMAADSAVEPQPTIPAYMVGRGKARGMRAADGATATIHAAPRYFRTGSDNIMAGFSGQGPTPDPAKLVKPDVVAPGANVLASVPAAECDADPCWSFMQGTSMAAPHLAGMAAVLRAAHPDWTSPQVRSAIVNTAAERALTRHEDGRTVSDDVTVTGAGLADLRAAVRARVAIGPVSTSFGTLRGRAPAKASVTLTSLTGREQRLSVSIDSHVGDGVRFTAPREVTVPAWGTTSITVRAVPAGAASHGRRSAGAAEPGPRSAVLRLSDSAGTDVAHSVLFALRR
ncbi:MAG: S8 family serine peptidase [Actinophytocola sp.]|nr:S8 family serine peptidase [Actinophytocola sp.]